MNQEMWVTCRNWTKQRNSFSSGTFRKLCSLLTPDHPVTCRIHVVKLLSVVICYSMTKTLTHHLSLKSSIFEKEKSMKGVNIWFQKT
jgi:hypothetical protein